MLSNRTRQGTKTWNIVDYYNQDEDNSSIKLEYNDGNS